jgi:hypothetical protein
LCHWLGSFLAHHLAHAGQIKRYNLLDLERSRQLGVL